MATTVKRVTHCDNHVQCGQSIEHVSEWPGGWGNVSLNIRDPRGYVSSNTIDLDLCPGCLKAAEGAILTALDQQRTA